MRVTADLREYRWFDPVGDGMVGGSELRILKALEGLADRGYDVHAVHAGAAEKIKNGVYFWPQYKWPRHTDVLLLCEQNVGIEDFEFDKCYLQLNQADPAIDQETMGKIDGYFVLSNFHKDLLLKGRPFLPGEKVAILPPGIDFEPYQTRAKKVPNRLIYCNASERGLYHMVDIWPYLKKRVPDVSLVITYDFKGFYERAKWMSDFEGIKAHAMYEWIESEPNVFDIGPCSKEQLVKEQKKAQLFAYPCDPPRYGSQLHCFAGMESGAARCALLLSDQEALYEVFEDVAAFLPIPIDPETWAAQIADFLTTPSLLHKYQHQARERAIHWSWDQVVDEWDKLLQTGEINFQWTKEKVNASS
jgi:glycosyltransferase involved in cell wall biosynthesis